MENPPFRCEVHSVSHHSDGVTELERRGRVAGSLAGSVTVRYIRLDGERLQGCNSLREGVDRRTGNVESVYRLPADRRGNHAGAGPGGGYLWRRSRRTPVMAGSRAVCPDGPRGVLPRKGRVDP